MKHLVSLSLLFSLLLLAACHTYKPLPFETGSQESIDDKTIIQYLQKKKLKKVKHSPSGLYYRIKKGGGPERPTTSSMISAHYEGVLLNGEVFDSSIERGEPIQFKLEHVIKGWQEAIPLLGKGGQGTFYIPSHLAYGAREFPGIPAYSILIFDIELLDFE